MGCLSIVEANESVFPTVSAPFVISQIEIVYQSADL